MHIPILAAGSVFDPLYNAIGAVLAFLYSLIPNLGVAIILLTFIVMLLLYPLTAKQAKSMLAMQKVQPEIKKLQQKYKGDRQKLNEEVMKFYQENKINPLAGCLPLVVQLPIFFTLFRVLRDPFKHIPKTGSFNGLYNALCGHSIHTLHKACTTSTLTHLKLVSSLDLLDLQKTATDSHPGGFLQAVPFFVLVALVVLTGYLQTRQAQSRTPQTNKQMATIMKILPVFFGLISLSFPAGLVLYFLISNMWRVGQQEVIFRRITSPGPAAGKLPSGDAIDVVGTDHDDGEDAEAIEPAQAEEPPRRPAPRKPAPAEPNPPRAATPTQERSGGLRGFFQLPPPPPEGNGGGRPPGATRPPSSSPARRAGTGSGAGQARRPPPQRRRSSKKKRKR